MTETQLTELADQVADALSEKNEQTNGALCAVGQIALIGGAIYVGIKLLQGAQARRELRKIQKEMDK